MKLEILHALSAGLLSLTGIIACSEQEDSATPFSGGSVGGNGGVPNQPDAAGDDPAVVLTDAALSALAADAASDAGAHALCAAYATHIANACPDIDPDQPRDDCEVQLRDWTIVGCRSEYLAATQCDLTAEVSCLNGLPTGCEHLPNFDECHQTLIDATDCARFPFIDGSCSPGEFGFLCVEQVPSGCSVVGEEDNSSNVCCPPFAD